MQVVVTGATGFIGSTVVERALDQGHTIFALVRDQSLTNVHDEAVKEGRIIPAPFGAESEVLVQGFGLEPGAIWINAAGLQRGRNQLELELAHPTLTRYLIDLAQDLEASQVVHLSPWGAHDSDVWGRSKLQAETIIQSCSRPWTILRSAPVYGTGDGLLDEIGAWMHRSPFIPRFLENVLLSPVHVDDVADALLKADPGVYDIGGETLPWGELLRCCATAAGKSLMGPHLSDATLNRIALFFGDRGWLSSLVNFDSESLRRHRMGYEINENDLKRILGKAPRSLNDYLFTEWAYRAKTG